MKNTISIEARLVAALAAHAPKGKDFRGLSGFSFEPNAVVAASDATMLFANAGSRYRAPTDMPRMTLLFPAELISACRKRANAQAFVAIDTKTLISTLGAKSCVVSRIDVAYPDWRRAVLPALPASDSIGSVVRLLPGVLDVLSATHRALSPVGNELGWDCYPTESKARGYVTTYRIVFVRNEDVGCVVCPSTEPPRTGGSERAVMPAPPTSTEGS